MCSVFDKLRVREIEEVSVLSSSLRESNAYAQQGLHICVSIFSLGPLTSLLRARWQLRNFFLDRWVKQLGVRPSPDTVDLLQQCWCGRGFVHVCGVRRTDGAARCYPTRKVERGEDRSAGDQGVVSFSGVRDVAW